MNWIPLQEMSQLDEIVTRSHQNLQVIFKHSTRCSISSMALNRLEREDTPLGIDFYYTLVEWISKMFYGIEMD